MKEKIQNFKPTADQVHAAENLFIAMAYTETIRPIVTGYQKAILARHNFQLAERWTKGQSKEQPRRILDPDHTYLMSDADFAVYMAEVRQEQEKAGLKTDNPEHCPLLVAEGLERAARRAFVDSLEPVFKVNTDKLLCSPGWLKTYKRFSELALKLFAPFVRSSSELLKTA